MNVPGFGEVVRAVHGRAPYEWQERAADELAQDGWWPALRAPTGAGKTTLIDCWLHALARAGPDRLGRRLVWVVDRRSVVDQVYEYAERVFAALCGESAQPAARALTGALTALSGGHPPRAALWRGGLDDEAAIALRDPLDPAAVAVVVSTVDQLGSRLLFRGYGLGVRSRALHAGLLGIDTTVVVDEAHIAEQLRQTAERICEIQSAAQHSPRPPLRVCAVSATHEAHGGFELTERERKEPAMAERVNASKKARLVKRNDANEIVRRVGELAADGARVVGVLLNTVGDARQAFEALAELAPAPLEDRVLLIGPIRPLDRDDLLGAIPDRSRRAERDHGCPFVVVATQTVEVGVDLDLDALVTACAPLEALVQRFGRLDRAGALGASRAFVLGPSKGGCPVYGDAAAQTWDWLSDVSGKDDDVDFGVEALRALVARHGSPPTPTAPRTLRLLDLHVQALSVTDGLDQEGPAVELLLHGDRATSAEVTVAWRNLPTPDGASRPTEDIVKRELELRPIHPGEAVTISLPAARRWLAGETPAPLADIESSAEGEPKPRAGDRDPEREPVAWRIGPDGAVEAIEDPPSLTPSDRLLASTESGGLDRFGWAPASAAEVTDLGSLSARGPRLVLDPEMDTVAAIAESLEAGGLTPVQAARSLQPEIAHTLPETDTVRPAFSEHVERTREALAAGRAMLLDDGRVLVIARGARTEHASAGNIVTLEDHQRAVEARAAEALAALGIRSNVAGSVLRAARHHDEGKRDPRFQAWLSGGQAAGPDALAKSAYAFNPARVARLREIAGWPAGKRHELVSAAALARSHPEDVLAGWLAATHHGLNRPFVAAVDDDRTEDLVVWIEGQTVQLAADAAPTAATQIAALADLSREYGPWGLAFLEALMVSADRAVSAAEAES